MEVVEEGLMEGGEAVECYTAIDVVEAGTLAAYDLQKMREGAGTAAIKGSKHHLSMAWVLQL